MAGAARAAARPEGGTASRLLTGRGGAGVGSAPAAGCDRGGGRSEMEVFNTNWKIRVCVCVCVCAGLIPYYPGQPSIGSNKHLLAAAGAMTFSPVGLTLLALTKCILLAATATKGLHWREMAEMLQR